MTVAEETLNNLSTVRNRLMNIFDSRSTQDTASVARAAVAATVVSRIDECIEWITDGKEGSANRIRREATANAILSPEAETCFVQLEQASDIVAARGIQRRIIDILNT